MLTVALVGKPNVGKSTLFNRVISQKKAIVDDLPGVTRDRIYSDAIWLNKHFRIIDTGGINNENLPFSENIEKQVKLAIEDANLILFVVSSKDGIDSNDKYVSKMLKKYKGKNVILVANKSENNNKDNERLFYSLGFGSPYYVSAEHGVGIGDLLDEVIKFKPALVQAEKEQRTKFCIIGRTNVGKSTLVNTILHEERVVTSPIEHTTRDSIDEDFVYNKKKYTIIDTAGIRRKGKITDNIEKYAVLRTQQAIERSDIILLVLDGSKPFNEQDEVIGGLAFKANMPTIIVINKWDALEKTEKTMVKMKKEVESRFAYLSWAPIVFISAIENSRVQTIFEKMNEIEKELKIKVSTSLLNNVLAKAQLNNPAPKFKGLRINISYGTQIQSQIPTFVLFSNDPKHLHFTYARYIENQIRDAFGIKYVPITVYYKDKNSRVRTSVSA